MNTLWAEQQPKLLLLEGSINGTEFCIRYPQLDSGRPAFDRFWQQQAFLLRLRCSQEQERWPVSLSVEWQETRRDAQAISGFLEIQKRIGRADWRLDRISATFFAGQYRPMPLTELLLPAGNRRLPSLVAQKIKTLSKEGETPFFRGAAEKAAQICFPGRYYLSGEGMAVWFPQNVLAPAIAGLPTVFFPFSEIQSLLRFSL